MMQQQTLQPQPPSEAARLFAVEKDVLGLKESMSALAATVDKGFQSLGDELKARSTTNWQPVQLGLTVVTIAGGIFFTWVNANTGRIEGAIAKIETNAQRHMLREEADVRFAMNAQRRDDLQRLTDARIERVERDLAVVSKEVVPRGEHEQMWATQRARDADLQRQADQVRQGLGDLNTPRDTIQRLQKQLDELERERRRPNG